LRGWLAAGAEAGHPLTDDFNGASPTVSAATSSRCAAAGAATPPPPSSRRREACRTSTVVTGAQATRHRRRERAATAASSGSRAASRERARRARGDPLGGTLQSPQLLQLSGIGPAALLRRHGIAVAVDAPEVGQEPADHYQARVIVKLKEKRSLNDDVRNPLRLARWARQWLSRSAGRSPVGAGQVGGLVATEHAEGGPRRRPLQRHAALGRQAGRSAAPLLGFPRRRRSAGPSRRARSRSRAPIPLALPRIRAGYLTDPRDAKVLVAGLRMLREIYAQPSFRGLVTGEEYLPGNWHHDAERARGLRPRQAAAPVFHPAGPAAWAATPARSVDERLRVRGVDGLARDRRLGDAAPGLDQHQRRGDRDRREGRRLLLEDLAGGALRRNVRRQEDTA
jgi:choline dehydrogenase